MLFFSSVQTNMTWGFQMSYYSSSQLKGLQNCDLSKLEIQRKSGTGSQATLEWAVWQNSFRTFNFDRSQFCSPLTKIMNNSLFESTNSYLYVQHLDNSKTALFRYVILPQINPILLNTEGNGWIFVFWLVLGRYVHWQYTTVQTKYT